jgi:hypothetical protein
MMLLILRLPLDQHLLGLACTGISFDPLFKDLRLTTTTYMVYAVF